MIIHPVAMPLFDFLRNLHNSVKRQYVFDWSEHLQEIYTTLTMFLDSKRRVDAFVEL